MNDVEGLAEFLLARLAEEAVAALKAAVEWDEQDWAEIDGYPQAHVFLHSPACVLAECNAKRRIVEAYREERARRDAYQAGSAELRRSGAQLRRSSAARCRGLEIAVQLLAEVHADHPDYDPGWRL